MTCAPDCTCHCGDGTRPTPHVVDNSPGLPSLAVRIGSFVSFRRTMLEALAARSELSQLTTRDADDAAISLIEQGAAIADVLSFYTERYANESYLGTATIDADVQRVAHLIGYRPAPGISATTTLAIQLDRGYAFTIAAGFGVQSVPGPGEMPQDFETTADVAADARFNDLPARPQQVFVDPLTNPSGALICAPYANELANALHTDDPVLLVVPGAPGEVVATKISEVTRERERLRITFDALLTNWNGVAFRPRRNVRLFGCDAPETPPPHPTADNTVPGGIRWNYGATTDFSVSAGTTLQLDRVYDDLAVGAQLAIYDGASAVVVTITRIDAVRATIGTTDVSPIDVQAGQATQVTVAESLPGYSDRRAVTIVEIASTLPLAGIDDDIFDTEVWIPGNARRLDDGSIGVTVAPAIGAKSTDDLVVAPSDLAVGRRLVLADDRGHALATTVRSDVTLFPDVVEAGDLCHLVVPLDVTDVDLWPLELTSVHVLGNAVAASHGKTVSDEIIGSSDASTSWQRFALTKSPLTRVPDSSPEGSSPALAVAVSGTPWKRIDQLLAAGPRDTVFSLINGADATTTVQFGDGEHAQRPTSGNNNLRATYRYGAGRSGRVSSGTLSNPASRPPGFSSVTNPVPAEGGADPEASGQTQVRAPRTVRVFGRAVSAEDYADLLLSNGTVAKAQAAQLWDGNGLVIGITVAGDEGSTFSNSALATLAASDKSAASPYQRVVLGNYVPVPISVSLTVNVDPSYDETTVVNTVRSAVAAAFAFDAVELGQHVVLSNVYKVAGLLPGVAAMNVTGFGFARPPGVSTPQWDKFLHDHGDSGDPTPEWLRLLRIRTEAGAVRHGEIPTLADADLTIAIGPTLTALGGGLE